MNILGLIDNPSTNVVAQGVPPEFLIRALWVSAKPIAPTLGVRFTPLPLDADVVLPRDVFLGSSSLCQWVLRVSLHQHLACP